MDLMRSEKEQEGAAALWMSGIWGAAALFALLVWLVPGPAEALSRDRSAEAVERQHHQAIKEGLKGRVYLINAPNGMPCAVMYERDSYGGTGGIDCDWGWRDRFATFPAPTASPEGEVMRKGDGK